MMCVAVIGTSGSGKTTFAGLLARRLGVRHVELDALHWEPNWTLPAVEAFRERVAAALVGDGWVADGNYSSVRDIVWGQADTLVWLDYPLPLVLFRLTKRTIRRSLTQEELWNGNREPSLIHALFDKDSLLRYAITTHARRRREWPALFTRPEFAHLRLLRFSSPRAAAAWLDAVPPS